MAGEANKFMTNEAANQWLVRDRWNKSVYNAQGKSIGDLNDVLVGPDGKIQALVIGVGGFLGLGEKNVADRLQLYRKERQHHPRPHHPEYDRAGPPFGPHIRTARRAPEALNR